MSRVFQTLTENLILKDLVLGRVEVMAPGRVIRANRVRRGRRADRPDGSNVPGSRGPNHKAAVGWSRVRRRRRLTSGGLTARRPGPFYGDLSLMLL